MKSVRFFLILCVLAACGYAGWRYLPVGTKPATEGAAKGGAPKSVPVTVATVETRDVPIWLTGLGTVQASNTVTVRPRVSGALEKVNFTEGQKVEAGDVLARVDPRPYESVLAQAKAKQAQSAALLANAKREVERIGKLAGIGAESRSRFEELEANMAQLTAQEQADAAAVSAAQLDLDFTSVKAPIRGRTGVRLIDEGNLVTANQTGGLVVITQLQPISVIVTLPQDQLPALQRRMADDKSAMEVQALGNDGKLLGEGTLELIDNQIDTTSGTLRLKATFPNKDLLLWPGQFINGRVLVETRKQALVVPTQVIGAGIDGAFAYVVEDGKTVRPRTLETGPPNEGFTIIEKGLKVGETVVLDGQSKLQPGAAVTIQKPTKP